MQGFFSSRRQFRYHCTKHRPRTIHTCPICSQKYSTNTSLSRHMFNHSKVTCDICNKKINKRRFKTHFKEVHSPNPDHECDLCPSKFNSKCKIIVHLKGFHKNGNFGWNLCLKKFAKADGLIKHKRIHVGIAQYKCLKCNKFFKSFHILIKKHKCKC